MYELAGTPSGIENPFMAVVAAEEVRWRDSRPLLLLVKSPQDLRRLSFRLRARRRKAGCLVLQGVAASLPEGMPGILDLAPESASLLTDGDVVKVDPDGKITVIYKVGSPHNSIMATHRCNCLCVMCPQPPTHDPEGLMENNLRLISLLDPQETECLGITGGEPTLLGEDLIRLVRACREKAPRALLTMLTNGRRLKDLEFARELVRAGFPNLFLEIPLFGDNDTEHDTVMGAKGSFYDTLQGLNNLARLGQPVGLRTILHALTVPRLAQYAEFVYRNLPFVLQVAFMGMEVRGLAYQNLDRLWMDPYEYGEQLSVAVRHLTRRKVPVSIYNHQLCILPRELWPVARKSITDWKQHYPPVCAPCTMKDSCGGVFGTGERYSDYLKPVTEPASSLLP